MDPQTNASTPKTVPAMDVVAPVPASAEPLATPPEEAKPKPVAFKADKPKTSAKTGASNPVKEGGPHTVAAIVATVVIVLGLGALTVFAYLKQTNSL